MMLRRLREAREHPVRRDGGRRTACTSHLCDDCANTRGMGSRPHAVRRTARQHAHGASRRDGCGRTSGPERRARSVLECGLTYAEFRTHRASSVAAPATSRSRPSSSRSSAASTAARSTSGKYPTALQGAARCRGPAAVRPAAELERGCPLRGLRDARPSCATRSDVCEGEGRAPARRPRTLREARMWTFESMVGRSLGLARGDAAPAPTSFCRRACASRATSTGHSFPARAGAADLAAVQERGPVRRLEEQLPHERARRPTWTRRDRRSGRSWSSATREPRLRSEAGRPGRHRRRGRGRQRDGQRGGPSQTSVPQVRSRSRSTRGASSDASTSEMERNLHYAFSETGAI